MKRSIKLISMGISATALLTAMMAMQSVAEEKVLSVYSPKDGWHEYEQYASEIIEEEYGIKIDLVTMPDADIEAVISTKLATGDPPDIFLGNAPQKVIQWNATQYCEPLDDEPWVERLAAPDVLKFSGDGHIYAMPSYAPTNFFGGIYYNKEKMKELGYENPQPKTMEEFWAILEDIKSQGVTPIYMTDADPWCTQVWTTMGWGVALDYEKDTIYDQLLSNQIKFSEIPEMVSILQDLQDLYNKGYVNENHLSQQYDTAQAAIGEGEYPMVIQGEWFETAMHDSYPDVELGAFAIPFNDLEMIGVGAYTVGMWVPKGDNSELAKEYLNLWSSPEVMAKVYEKFPGASAWNDVDGGELLPGQSYLIENYVNTGKYTSEFDSYFDIARSVMNDYMFGAIVEVTTGKDPETALAEYDEKYEEFMAEKEVEGF